MAQNFQQDGDRIPYTSTGAATSAGDVVVIGNVLGVALVDIAENATGTVAIKGVFTCPKVSGAVIAQGEKVTWDSSAGAFDDSLATPATGDVTGASAFAFEAKGTSTTTIAICFTGVPGTVT